LEVASQENKSDSQMIPQTNTLKCNW